MDCSGAETSRLKEFEIRRMAARNAGFPPPTITGSGSRAAPGGYRGGDRVYNSSPKPRQRVGQRFGEGPAGPGVPVAHASLVDQLRIRPRAARWCGRHNAPRCRIAASLLVDLITGRCAASYDYGIGGYRWSDRIYVVEPHGAYWWKPVSEPAILGPFWVAFDLKALFENYVEREIAPSLQRRQEAGPS
jgi:hypothetical protein